MRRRGTPRRIRNLRDAGFSFLGVWFLVIGFSIAACGKTPDVSGDVSGGASDNVSTNASDRKAIEPEAEGVPTGGIERAAIEGEIPGVPADAIVVAGYEAGVAGGRLITAIAGDPKTFNPVISTDVTSTDIIYFLFDGLFDYDRLRQEPVPRLAKSWEYDEATHRWTFHLREGIRWSDGVPITSDDFLFTAEAIFDPDVPSQYRDLMAIEGEPYTFTAPDPRTLVVQIPGVDSTAFIQLINLRALPRHIYGKALEKGIFAETLGLGTPPEEIVTSGPLRVKAFSSGDRLLLGRNPHFYRFDERGTRLPYLDELALQIVPDFDAMALRFQSGDLDLYESPIQPQNLLVIQEGAQKGDYSVFNPGVSLRSVHYWFNLKPGGSYDGEDGERELWEPLRSDAVPPPEILAKNFRYYIAPYKRRWFERDEFRQACSMATDRASIVRTIYFGQADPLYGFVSPADATWHNPDIPKFPYDPEKAKALLDSIDFIDRDGDGIREDPEGHPIRFTIVTNKENKIRDKIGVLLKEALGRLGFEVRLQLLDFNNILTRLDSSYDYEACILGLSSGVPPHPADASNIWLSSSRMHHWNPNQKEPMTEWEGRIDELYAEFQRTFDLGEQKRIYDEMQVIWAEHQGLIYLVVDQLWIAASNNIGNLRPSLLRPYLTHNFEVLYLKSN